MTDVNIKNQPNILLIVADDLGFSDLGAFGGEINTPHLNELALNGLRLTNFHTASTCSPTRAMLLSGTDHHLAGLGTMAEALTPELEGKEGYEGVLNNKVAALPELLKDAGYYTIMSGKWHLGLKPEYFPIKKGFERSFALLPGAANHYLFEADIPEEQIPRLLKSTKGLYAEDDEFSEELPQGFYSSDYFTTRLLDFLQDDERQGRPFLHIYLSLHRTGPYRHLRKISIDIKDAMQMALLNCVNSALKTQATSLVDAETTIHPVLARTPFWENLTQEQRDKSSRIRKSMRPW